MISSSALHVHFGPDAQEVEIMRSCLHVSLLSAALSAAGVLLCLLLVSAVGPAWATASGPFTFENADIQTVVKEVAALTGITFLFDPEQVKGKSTLLAPTDVSSTDALELLKSALALHGYAFVSRGGSTWIVPAERVAQETFIIKVVRLTHAPADELAYTLSWVAPPSVRIVPYLPTNSVIIAGDPAVVEELVDIIK